MAIKRMFFDKTEINVSYFAGRNYITKNLSAPQIQRIQFDKIREFSIFRFVNSEKISITNSTTPQPIVYTKKKEKAFFDEYKEELKIFAKNNNVTMQDNTVTGTEEQ